jgi:alternate signal-mediated exported protein
MNKLIKGAVAGTAAIALLLGGAGTFALWNDSASASMGTISSGTLDITKVSAPVWTDLSTNAVIGDISTFALVPGDKISYSQTVSVAARGNNLKAELTVDPSGLAGWTAGSTDLLNNLTISTAVDGVASVLGTPIAVASTKDVHLSATIEMLDTVSGQTAQGESINLSGLAFTLKQK